MSLCRLTVLNMKVVPAALWNRLSLFHSIAFILCWFYLYESVSGFCILCYGFIFLFFQLYHTVWIAIALLVHFSCSVMSNSLWPHGLQHTRFLCPSPTPELVQTQAHWVGDAIQPSHPLVPFSSCLQSFPASRSFSMSWSFASGDQSTRVSASASVLPMNIQDWFPLGWTGWISLQSKGLWRVFSNTTVQKHQFFSTQLYSPTLTSIHDYWKNHSFD